MASRYFFKLFLIFFISLFYICCNTSIDNDETKEELVVRITFFQRPDNYYNDDQDEILGEFEISALDTLDLSSSNAGVQKIIFNIDTLTVSSAFSIGYFEPGTIIYFLEGDYTNEWFSSYYVASISANCLTGNSNSTEIWLSFNGYCYAFIIEEPFGDSTNSTVLNFSGENIDEELILFPESNKLHIDNWYHISKSDLMIPSDSLKLRINLEHFEFDEDVLPMMLIKTTNWPFWYANFAYEGGSNPINEVDFLISTSIREPSTFIELYVVFVKY